ncbi:hypothetical protein L2E82_27976 [Cichorium intybus]|uniref:Uncharacterized protein n=1 Tax=Cichorium intybus TaxID=13427 RepID=A0ACB9CUY1_CICIN|nr:hypothetical protein L2E82_27976 [Cichorium intybus]
MLKLSLQIQEAINSTLSVTKSLSGEFQPGFGYQQQLVPGMRPGSGPMPNFFMPMVQQGQQGQQGLRPGGRHATGLGHLS